ncbi:hypothetical protein WR25_04406 [Diploscapter pachys]|uniref:Uncharacterized protein n=1 Tax=Diploscapter pachys TaxID=2018661 RepID=A0A2A2J8I5_9BILA|nr:hypothetical protein WR25_04406 [Diploscapter pachys]
MSTLTDADRARIAQNRARALQLSAERKAREAAAEETARTQALQRQSMSPSISQLTLSGISPSSSLLLPIRNQSTPTPSNSATPSSSAFSRSQSASSSFSGRPSTSRVNSPSTPSGFLIPKIKVTFELTQGDRMVVKCAPSHSFATAIIKQTSGAVFDKSRNEWSVPMQQARQLERSFKSSKASSLLLNLS